MRSKFNSTNTEVKKVERRIETLREHLRHSGNFKSYRKIKARYEELYSQYNSAKKETGFLSGYKSQKALDAVNEYYEGNHSQLSMHDSAEQYLRDVLHERFDPKKQPSVTKWQEELAAKIVEKDALYRKYYLLKDETQKVESIKRGVENILKENEPRTRTKDVAKGHEI